MELQAIELKGGAVLHQLSREWDDGPHVLGLFQVLPTGQAQIWRQVWVDEYAPTEEFFPGPISAIRAIACGEV